MEDSAVCRVEISPLLACTETVPSLTNQFISLINQQVFNNQQEFISLVAKKSSESLIAAFILNVYQRTQLVNSHPKQIHLTMGRDNIACFLGIRRETLSRVLSKFQKANFIHLQGKKITLVNEDKLAVIAESS